MIIVKNQTVKLRENKKELLDTNSIINEQMLSIIKKITLKLKSISPKHDATVIFSGKIDNINVDIKSDSEKSVTAIESLINDYLK
ncbi:hypothetical protein J4050_07505 [Winogradskyella sp. DF17]|uniref:Uncharacterized protein n=1 Tax=Winogradskyella pelagia TaxID=2819984 RepID=A0ABS3T1G0_9FLAO|nr:hypothetical protein [Winogradskyella sp. DF17]MBO3116586.1 hypothetical protein [Winogradskyella sp. DF17]